MAATKMIVNPDKKRRVVLPKSAILAEYYEVEVTSKQEIIFRPRMIVDPSEVISKRTLTVLDESMKNVLQGQAGEPVDLSIFADEDETHEEQAKTKKAKPIRRK